MLENLDRLKIFYHVYSLKSVGKAAETLYVTQPAVSQAIHKLEDEIETQLFVRRHRQLIPTAEGERLFNVVEPFLRELGDCLRSFDHAKNEPFGELRIGSPAEFGKAYLPAIMAAFRAEYPGVTFYLEYGTPEVLGRRLQRGKLDLALMDMFLVGKKAISGTGLFHVEPVVEEEVILACSAQYHAAHIPQTVTADTLSGLDFIEYTRSTRTVEHWFQHHFNTTKISFRTVMTLHSHDAVISAIKHHTGLGVVASHLVDADMKSGEIIPVKTDRKDIVNRISLVHLQDKIPTLAEKEFRRFLLKELHLLGF